MTEPHDPEDTPTHAEDGHPSSGGEEWSTSFAEPPTEPGWARSEVPPAPSAEPTAESSAGSYPGSAAGPYSESAAGPYSEPYPAGPPRSSWWRSRRVRVGAAGTLAGLVLLGGGFGAGYAVADASAPAPATHVAAAKAHSRKGTAAAARRKRQEQQGTAPQQQPGAAQPGTIPG